MSFTVAVGSIVTGLEVMTFRTSMGRVNPGVGRPPTSKCWLRPEVGFVSAEIVGFWSMPLLSADRGSPARAEGTNVCHARIYMTLDPAAARLPEPPHQPGVKSAPLCYQPRDLGR